MKLKSTVDNEVIVSISVEELQTICNALNEVCNAFGIDDFQTRMGVTMEEAQILLLQISEVFREI